MNQSLNLNIISKIFSILEQDVKDETENDSPLKEIIRMMFSKDSESNIIGFPNVKVEYQKLLAKFIELIYLMFQIPKDQRDKLWKIDVKNIKDKNISNLILELEDLQNIEVEFPNQKLVDLCDIIFPCNVKNKYTLIDYVYAVIGNISYIPQMNILLKFRVYSFLIDNYACVLGQKIDFRETELNLDDEISIDIILDLLKKNKNDNLFIQLLVILKYESVRNTIIKHNMGEILQAFINTNNKRKKKLNIPTDIYYEKIIMIFNEEFDYSTKDHNDITNENYEHDKANYIKEEKKEHQISSIIYEDNNNQQGNEQTKNIESEEKKFVNVEDNSSIINAPINMITTSKKLSKEIKSKKESHVNKKKEEENNIIKIGDINKNNIKALLNNILKMDKDSKVSYINELKDILFKIIDDNDMMKKQNEKMNVNLNSLIKELDSVKKELDSVKNDLYEVKQILGNIQIRDSSKNFLRSFKKYLSDEDLEDIEDNYFEKGTIISNAIKEKFSNCKEKRKMVVLLNLIGNSFNSLTIGNSMTHSISIDIYEKDIQEYKKNKKMKSLNSVYIFCFLVGLGISKEYFDESFTFLRRFFNSNLTLKKGGKKNTKGFLETYFD